MESGVIVLASAGTAPLRLARGMIVLTADGVPAGWVAGVLVSDHTRLATHLLVRTTMFSDPYRLAPTTLVTGAAAEMIYLSLVSHEISKLPVHCPA